MSYWGLFWETGMPAVWALSRKSVDRPENGMEAQTWPLAAVDQIMRPEDVLSEAGERFRPEQAGGSGENR